MCFTFFPLIIFSAFLIVKYASEGLSSNYIVQLLDKCSHQSPNGIHQCLVFELLGPSLADFFEYYFESAACVGKQDQGGFHPLTILRLSKQLVEAVRFIHHVGMCRGGMLFPSDPLAGASDTDR